LPQPVARARANTLPRAPSSTRISLTFLIVLTADRGHDRLRRHVVAVDDVHDLGMTACAESRAGAFAAPGIESGAPMSATPPTAQPPSRAIPALHAAAAQLPPVLSRRQEFS
jgi:hypothetical protein